VIQVRRTPTRRAGQRLSRRPGDLRSAEDAEKTAIIRGAGLKSCATNRLQPRFRAPSRFRRTDIVDLAGRTCFAPNRTRQIVRFGGAGLQSGAMRWKGQVCSLDQCAFTENQNVALLVPGAAGLGQTLTIRDTAFENNHGRHLVCTGITGFRASGLQVYSNDAVRARSGLLFDASHYVVRGVDIDGVVVRATAGNGDFAAFVAQGANLDGMSIRARGVTWDNFDYPGQRRFDGFLFDDVRQCCVLRQISPREVAFGPDASQPRGNKTPLRLRGGGGGAPSSTGEWIEAAITSDLVLSSDAMAPRHTYWIYLYDDNGRMRLEASAAAPILDRWSGYPVRPDDPAKLSVGSLRTDASGAIESVT